MIGEALGHYRIEAQLGAGSRGVVYRAYDTKLQRRVAIKLLNSAPDPPRRSQLLQEARAASVLNHRNICVIHEVQDIGEHAFIVMEYAEGRPLRELLPSGGLSAEKVVSYGTQIADALAHAHQRGVIHRDLKSSNVVITSDGLAKVLDFGVARRLPQAELEELTHSQTSTVMLSASKTSLVDAGQVVGTLPYIAPDVLRGELADERSDLWSFGVLLYEMATGELPFQGRTGYELTAAILHEPPPTLPAHVPDTLRAVIQKCLEKEPGERYQRASDVLAELAKTSGAVSRLRAAVAAAALAGVISATVGGTIYIQRLATRLEVAPAGSSAPLAVKFRPSVAVLGFKNLSGRSDASWLSTAIAEMLTTELASGEKLRMLPGENVAHMKIDLALGDADSFGRDTLTRMRQYLGADLVVLGSYVSVGGRLRLDVRVQDAAAADTVLAATETGTEADLIDIVQRAGARLRDRLGIGQLAPTDIPTLRASMPAAPESARLYAEGLARLRVFDALAARDLLQRVVITEPNHALAHAALAAAWAQLGYDTTAKQVVERAFSLSANLSRETRLAIEAHYRQASNDWAGAAEIYRILWELFPDDAEYGLRLAAVQTAGGQAKDALATVAALHTLPPPAGDDPRIDIEEASAASRLSDFNRARQAAATALRKATEQRARLLAARALDREGWAFWRLGESDQAWRAYEQARQIYVTVGDRFGEAEALNGLGTVLWSKGDLAGAQRMYAEALAVARRTGGSRLVAKSLNDLGNVTFQTGDLLSAKKLYQESIGISLEIGDRSVVIAALNNIAQVLLRQADLPGARGTYEKALQISRALGAKSEEAIVLGNLAVVLFLQGDLASAHRLQEEALVIRRAIGEKAGLAFTMRGIGDVLRSRGDLAAAKQMYDEALRLFRDVGNRGDAAKTQLALAALAIDEGRPAEAAALARPAAEEFRGERRTVDEAQAHEMLARALLAERRLAEAERAITDAMERLKGSADQRTRLEVAVTRARVWAGSGAVSEAVKLLESTLAEATKFGIVGGQFEIRLALAEVTMRAGNVETARADLRRLRRDASSKGFDLIARKADAALRRG